MSTALALLAGGMVAFGSSLLTWGAHGVAAGAGGRRERIALAER